MSIWKVGGLAAREVGLEIDRFASEEDEEAPGEEVLLTQSRQMGRRLADPGRFAWSLACCGRFLGSAAAQKRSGWKVVKMRNPTAPNQGGFQNPQGCVSGDRGGCVCLLELRACRGDRDRDDARRVEGVHFTQAGAWLDA